MTSRKSPKKLDQLCSEVGLKRDVFLHFVRKEWIHSSPSGQEEWYEEDILRARLITELQRDFGVNDEAVPVILHLIDQLNALHRVLTRLDLESVAEISLAPPKSDREKQKLG